MFIFHYFTHFYLFFKMNIITIPCNLILVTRGRFFCHGLLRSLEIAIAPISA